MRRNEEAADTGGASLPYALTRGQVTFLRHLVGERPTIRLAPGLATWFARRHAIGTQHGREVHYGQADFASAVELLRNAQHEPTVLTTSESHFSTSCRVKVVQLGTWPPYALPGSELEPSTLDQLNLDAVVVCSSITLLEVLHRLAWLRNDMRGKQVLAVARPSSHSLAPPGLGTWLRDGAFPVWAAIDLHPAALYWASTLPRLERLCLPPADVLRRARSTFDDENFELLLSRFRARLDRADQPQIQQTWKAMRLMAKGYKLADFAAY